MPQRSDCSAAYPLAHAKALSQHALTPLDGIRLLRLRTCLARASRLPGMRELPRLRKLFSLSFPLIQCGEIHNAH